MPRPEFAIPLSAPDLSDRDIDAVVEVLRGRVLSRGPRLQAFEERLAGLTGTGHAIGVSSGTAGLHLALTALGVGPGDEVITSPFAVPATANAIRQTGARVVFADIHRDSLNMDPERTRKAVSGRTRALLAVHTFGLPAEMRRLRALGLPIVEDACEALGATVNGCPAGSLGDVGVFGFYPNKQITTGEGGMVVTDREDLAHRVRALRNHGRTGVGWLDQREPGFNYRLPELACALGVSQLERLDAILDRGRAIAQRYLDALGEHPLIRMPPVNPAGRDSWFVFVVRLDRRLPAGARDRVSAAMAARGIQCGRYFAPLHLQPAAAGEGHGAFPVTESVAQRSLALPFFNRITEPQIDTVCAVLKESLAAETSATGAPVDTS